MGKSIQPFLRIHKDEGGVQERLQIADSTSIEFVEKITIIEKKKKKRKKRKKDKDIAEAVVEEGEGQKVEEEKTEEVVIKEIETDEEIKADPGAFPPVEIAESMEEAVNETQEETVKVKIIKEYFIKIRTILTFEDGKVEDQVKEIPIKKNFSLFETESNNDPTIAPFELEISPKKGKPITVFLTKKQTVSAIQIEGKKYLMRGH